MQNIIITSGDTVLRATLNDTVAARDFSQRLPLAVSRYDSGIDYCCTAASGVFDPTEMQTGWKNGDISEVKTKQLQLLFQEIWTLIPISAAITMTSITVRVTFAAIMVAEDTVEIMIKF